MIRARQAHVFVGRQEQLRLFEDNLGLPAEDPRRRFLFSVYGDAGIGKSFLVRQLGRAARERGWLTGYVDHGVTDVPEAMAVLVGELSRSGARCKEFSAQFQAYRQRRRELDADPSAPKGMSALLTRSAVRVGLRAAGDVPFLGALAGVVDADAAADQADRLRQFVAGKFRNDGDVRLVLSPVEALTPVFVADLTAAAAKAPVGLFFDTYERTGKFLDGWLLDLLAGRYGELPVELVLTVAGQHPLDANRWADFFGFRADVPLRVFTDEEARELLAARGVSDPRVVEVVLTLSGRLPVLLAMLAEGRPDSPEAVGDPSGSAVERFLRWEDDDARRQAALFGALPRTLNADVLAAALGQDEAAGTFAWLRTLPFVTAHADGYQYHDVVRTPMLRHVRRESPSSWRAAHDRLADLFQTLRDATGLTGGEGWRDAMWAHYAREQAYHRLCAGRPDALVGALHGAIDTFYWSTPAAARTWTETILQAGREADLAPVTARGETLLTLADATDSKIAFLTSLADDSTLDDQHRARAFADRGETYRLAGRYEEALADFTRAVDLDPSSTWAVTNRGRTYREMGRYEEALADFTRAVDLDPSSAWAVANRGETYYREMGRYEEALADFTRAVDLVPPFALAIASRGETYRAMGRYEEALADFTRAVDLDPSSAWAVAGRGRTYQAMGRYEEALADFTRAVDLDPNEGWGHYELALIQMTQGETSKASVHLQRALETDRTKIESMPFDARVWFNVAVYLVALGREVEAAAQIRATLSCGASSTAVRDLVDDLEGLHQATGRFVADLVAGLTGSTGG